MKNIVALTIVDVDTNKMVAIMRENDTQFSDPHGGVFTDHEQQAFRCIAAGVMKGLWLHENTKHEKFVKARLEAIFP